MDDKPPIVLPHGGYRKLIPYQKSDVIYQGTVVFCRRFLPARGDRTVDQMVQAARSCKQNIAEGSSASGTSTETEIRLTNVARASLEELLQDYLDYLKAHDMQTWPASDHRIAAARDFARTHADWATWRPIFEKRPAETICNLQITLINQAQHLLARLIASQEDAFRQHGGVRERMHAARTQARGEQWNSALFSYLDGATSVADLNARLRNVQARLPDIVRGIKSRKGWR